MRRSTMDIGEHLEGLARLLDLERAEEKRRFESASASLSWEARRDRGLALLDLKQSDTRSLAGRVLVELRPTRDTDEIPPSLIGAGSIVKLVRRRGADPEDETPSAVVSRLSRDRISLAFDAPPPEWLEGSPACLELQANDVTAERLRAGMRRLATGDDKHLKRWRELLSGERPPEWDDKPEPPAESLNPEQNDALGRALGAKDLALVHGPPGTGKTTVLEELVRRATARGERVLVSAASNLAVDNLLARLADLPARSLRLGHVARVTEALLPFTLEEQLEASVGKTISRELLDEAHQLLARARKLATRGRAADRFAEARQARHDAGRLFREARERVRAARRELVARAQVIYATCTGAEVELLDGQLFDLAVVDEATQASEPAALLPLVRARRAVLAGDPRQLPPTVLSPEAARRGLSRSLFERLLELHGPGIRRMLREQYRMHERIMEFPSRQMYRGELRAHGSVAAHTLAELEGVEATELTSAPLWFVDTAGKGWEDESPDGSDSRRNPEEAQLVVAQVRRLLEAGLAPERISVIAPYAAQVQLLRAAMPRSATEIDTVDGFQGRENEAVIVSLTRSNDSGEIGFLGDLRRMNVAITRARRFLMVVGDSATVGGDDFYRGFIDHVTAAGGYRSAWEL